MASWLAVALWVEDWTEEGKKLVATEWTKQMVVLFGSHAIGLV